jgi:hypothetical protein
MVDVRKSNTAKLKTHRLRAEKDTTPKGISYEFSFLM